MFMRYSLQGFWDLLKEGQKVNSLHNRRQFPPVYHYHIRKTAGTSINFAFLSQYGGNDTAAFYEKLAQKRNHRLIANEKVFVGWNKYLIEQGKYFYAFSHLPAHALQLPENTYTITCLRDPAERVISHYKMLMHYKREQIPHPCMKIEGPWLGNSFDDFLQNIPKKHLLNQLFMFSKNFDVGEAAERIRSCSYYFLMEDFDRALLEIGGQLNIELPIFYQKKYNYEVSVSDRQMHRLKTMLEQEYDLITKLTHR